LALELLESRGCDTTGLRSKSWDEFSQPGALPFDLILTLCDRAKEEACPVWPGQPEVAHWGFEDPAACVGTEAARRAAFLRVFSEIQRRVESLVASGIASHARSNGGP
jgi:arsenate reductase